MEACTPLGQRCLPWHLPARPSCHPLEDVRTLHYPPPPPIPSSTISTCAHTLDMHSCGNPSLITNIEQSAHTTSTHRPACITHMFNTAAPPSNCDGLGIQPAPFCFSSHWHTPCSLAVVPTCVWLLRCRYPAVCGSLLTCAWPLCPALRWVRCTGCHTQHLP